MSLYLTYRRQCEGAALAHRLGLLTADTAAEQLFTDHTTYGPGADSAAKAMRHAKKAGWVRLKRELPVFPGGPVTTITYDLCPGCKSTFVDK